MPIVENIENPNRVTKKYVPPGRRAQELQKQAFPKTNTFNRAKKQGTHAKKIEIDLSLTESSFPELETKTKESSEIKEHDLSQDYKKATTLNTHLNTQKTEDMRTMPPQIPPPGWVWITRKNHKTIFNYGTSQIKTDQLNNTKSVAKEIYDLYERMSKHWNAYRDDQNELLGDCSPYINYKTEIDQMVAEENKIRAEMDEYKTNKNSYSDEEDDMYNDMAEYYD